MISLRKILREISDAPPPAITQNAQVFSSDFSEFVKNLENADKTGYKNGKWYPHKSYEGGFPTIAWGHKIQSKDELSKYVNGITDREAEQLLAHDLERAGKIAKDSVKKFGVNIPLSVEQMEMLTEFVFNLGNLDKFPKFTKAVLNKDWGLAEKEYKRYANGKELTRRNKLFYDRYFK